MGPDYLRGPADPVVVFIRRGSIDWTDEDRMVAGQTLLHQDDGLAGTRVAGESLADLELRVFTRFLSSKGRVLDIGCGHGRACRYLGTMGFETVGVELDLQTLQEARVATHDVDHLILADGRRLPLRDESFDYVICLASTLSEKHRLWMDKNGRVAIIRETIRVARPNGLILVSFVHRYWSLTGLFAFFKNYVMWIAEKATMKRTELGDYVEKIGRSPIRYHAFTIREARSLFPNESARLTVWKRGGLFTDWFFVIAEKTRLGIAPP